jgi:hypothetical protein
MSAAKEDQPGQVWVLDTETKGTGANMVPLERVLRHGSEAVPGFALPARRRRAAESPHPRAPHRFRILDVMTRQTLAEDVNARQAVETLGKVRSIVDVSIYARQDCAEEWRRLSFGETKALWDLRARAMSDS